MQYFIHVKVTIEEKIWFFHWEISISCATQGYKIDTISFKISKILCIICQVVAPNPQIFFSLNKISVFFGVFQCKNFLNRSNPRFSVPLRSPTRNGSWPRIGDLGRARLWRQMENDAKVLSVITLFFGIFGRLSTTKIISLGLHSQQNSEKFYYVFHFVGFRDELWLRRLGS